MRIPHLPPAPTDIEAPPGPDDAIIFDIETAADSDADRLFEQGEVRIGNLKDPEKIAVKIAEAKAKFVSDAALKPETASVICIGYISNGKFLIDSGDEHELIERFWELYVDCTKNRYRMIGANIYQFDLPFLCRRSWINNIAVPHSVRDGRFWSRSFVDISETWLCGQRNTDVKSSLDYVSRLLGYDGKNGNGKDFSSTWKSNREEAERYVKNDLLLTHQIAARLGDI